MLTDFAIADSTTLQCLRGVSEVVIGGDALALGPLVETLMFRRRSISPSLRLKVSVPPEVGSALRQLPADRTWSFRQSGAVGVLRAQHGTPSEADELESQRFLLALLRAATSAGMPRPAAQAIAGAAGELLDNITQHAGTGEDALAAFSTEAGSLWLSVGDAGQGMLPTYSKYPVVTSAKDALQMAVVEHRSSTGEPERGQGYRDLLRALGSLDASLRVRTGDASLECEGVAGSRPWVSREQVQLVGCVVSAHLRW